MQVAIVLARIKNNVKISQSTAGIVLCFIGLISCAPCAASRQVVEYKS